MVCLLGAYVLGLRIAPFSISDPGDPVDRLLKKVSSLTGQTLVCDTEVAKDIVCVDVHDVDPEEFRAKLAACVDAEWRKSGDRLMLFRSPMSVERQEKAEIESRGSSLLTQVKAALSKLPAWSPAFESGLISSSMVGAKLFAGKEESDIVEGQRQLVALSRIGPAGRALTSMLASMPARALGEIRTGDCLVYSSEPTEVQRGLPGDCREILAEFNREQADWAHAVAARGENSASTFLDPRFGAIVSHKPATKVLLNLRRSFGPSLTASLKLADDSGWVLATSVYSFGDWVPRAMGASGGSDSLDIDPGTVDLAKMLSLITQHPTDAARKLEIERTVAAWSDRIQNPEKNDPIAMVAGPLVMAYAKARNINLVACLPDRALNWYPIALERPTAQQLLARIQPECRWIEEGKWCVMKPHDPCLSRYERMSREALGYLARLALSGKPTDVDSLAHYAILQPSPVFAMVYDVQLASLAKGYAGNFAADDLMGLDKRAPLRVYGALSDSQRALLKKGGSIPFTAFSNQAALCLADYLFGWDWKMTGLLDRVLPSPPDATYVNGNIATEATEAFPTGVPRSFTLAGNPGKEMMVVYQRKENGVDTDEAYDADSLGVILASVESTTLSHAIDPDARFRCADADSLTLKFQFSTVASTTVVWGWQPTIWGDPVTFDRIPETFRAAGEASFSKRVEAMKKAAGAIPP